MPPPDDPAARRMAGRFGSVRVRTTLAAVTVVALGLALAGVAMVIILRSSLTDQVLDSITARAEAVASAIESGAPPPMRVGDDEDLFIQVVGPDGRVVDASANIGREPVAPRIRAGDSARVTGAIPGEDDRFLVTAAPLEAGGLVVVGSEIDSTAETTGLVAGLLAVALPLLLGLVGVTTWFVTGRSLAPVEAMRAEVDGISAADLSRRIPEPETDDEIRRLAATMNRMLDRLEAAQARQRAFVSDASHELRSPLSAMRQHAEVALEHPDVADVTDLASVVVAEGLRMQALVDDLLVLARADEGRLGPIRAPVDLDDVVFEVVRSVSGQRADTTGVSAGRVRGDRRLLQRLVRNLLDNAYRHGRERVAVSLAEAGDQVLLRVDDDGPGIPPGDRDRVFERFVRLDSARDRDRGGAGLGLAIVAEVADAHGGSARIVESPLGGVRVEVRLPRAD